MSQSGILSISSTPGVAAQFTTDSGIAVPSANNLNILGGLNIETSGSGDTVTISTVASPTFTSLTLMMPLAVADGGTGVTNFIEYSPIVGGTTAFDPLQYVDPTGASSGEVLTYNGPGTLPTWQALPSSGVTSITGTANQVLANGTSGTPQTGAVTLTLPQDIATTSTVQFDTETLTGRLFMASGASNNSPVISVTGDTNTGINFPLPDSVTICAGGLKAGFTSTSINFLVPFGVQVIRDSLQVAFANLTTNVIFIDTQTGTILANGTFQGLLGSASAPIYQVDHASSTGLGIYASATNHLSASVQSLRVMDVSIQSDTDVFTLGSYFQHLMPALINSTTSDPTGGVLLETTGASTANACARIFLSESGYNNGLSFAYNGSGNGNFLNVPGNTGAIVVHNSTSGTGGQNRMVFPQANNRIGINFPFNLLPSNVFDIRDPTNVIARFTLMSEQGTGLSDVRLRTNDTWYGLEGTGGTTIGAGWNHSNGYMGLGTAAGSAAKRLHMANTQVAQNQFWIQNTGNGYASAGLVSTMASMWLTSGDMSATNFGTPSIFFGSTDANFTTQNPKPLAMIVGRATQIYNDDSDSGMALDIYTSPINAGISNVYARTMSICFDVGIDFNAPVTMNFSERFFNIQSCQWYALNVAGTDVQMIWACDDQATNIFSRFSSPCQMIWTRLSMAVDGTATGNITYLFTITNETTGNTATTLVGITSADSSAIGSFNAPLVAALGDVIRVTVRVNVGTPVSAELMCILYGAQYPS